MVLGLNIVLAVLFRFGPSSLTISKFVPHICKLLGDPNSQVRMWKRMVGSSSSLQCNWNKHQRTCVYIMYIQVSLCSVTVISMLVVNVFSLLTKHVSQRSNLLLFVTGS